MASETLNGKFGPVSASKTYVILGLNPYLLAMYEMTWSLPSGNLTLYSPKRTNYI